MNNLLWSYSCNGSAGIDSLTSWAILLTTTHPIQLSSTELIIAYHVPIILHLFFLNFPNLGKRHTTSGLVVNVTNLGLVLGSFLSVKFHV